MTTDIFAQCVNCHRYLMCKIDVRYFKQMFIRVLCRECRERLEPKGVYRDE